MYYDVARKDQDLGLITPLNTLETRRQNKNTIVYLWNISVNLDFVFFSLRMRTVSHLESLAQVISLPTLWWKKISAPHG